MPTIEHLLSGDGPDVEAVRAFVREHRSPVVEGSSVTFLYDGRADQVHLRHFIMGFPRKQSFHRIDGTDLWYLTMEIPEGSRIEYKLEVVRGGKRGLILDPLNPGTAQDPFGVNSVCYGAGYERPDWSRQDPEARPGELRIVKVHSAVYDADVELRVYLPARMRETRRYPLLVAFDGEDYLAYSALQTVLDNLIHRYEIPPLIVALSQSPDRFSDYTASPEHARFVAEELVPGLTAQLPVLDDPRSRGLMGASLGAVASFFTAWQYPDAFGNLLLQSGSFRFNDTGYEEHHPALGSVVDFVNAYRQDPRRVAERVYVSCGRYESLIWDNRALEPHLQRSRMRVLYEESRDGHNWENWRDRLRSGLSWLFPGPLGLIYE